jgi:hypothetical protein
MTRAVRLLAILSVALSACAASGPGATTGAASDTGGERPIARLHASKCGSCHVPVAPGTRSREAVERAMERHGRRVRLTAEQWTAMIEYLAPPLQARSASDQNVR